MNRLLKGKVFPVIISMVVAFIITEFVMRIADPIGMKYFDETEKYFKIMVPHSRYGYIHKPGYFGKFQGQYIEINKYGFRGYWPQNKYKSILILGDSIVFGWGVDYENTFPSLLYSMALFNKVVYQVGVGSWNTRCEYEYLKDNCDKFETVFLFITSNDIEPKWTVPTDIPKNILMQKDIKTATHPASKFAIIRHFQYWRTMQKTIDKYSVINAEHPKWIDVQLAIEKIIALCQHEKIEIYFCIYGSYKSIERDNVLKLYYDFLSYKKQNIITFPDELFSLKNCNSIVDRHPNKKGHFLIAERLIKYIRTVHQ